MVIPHAPVIAMTTMQRLVRVTKKSAIPSMMIAMAPPMKDSPSSPTTPMPTAMVMVRAQVSRFAQIRGQVLLPRLAIATIMTIQLTPAKRKAATALTTTVMARLTTAH